MKTTHYRGSWIVTLPVAGLAVAYVFLVFQPGRKAIDRLSDELVAEQDFIALAEAVGPAIQTIRQQLRETLAYNTARAESIPEQAELTSLFGRIHALAKASGAITTRFDPEPPLPLDRLRRIPVVIGCTGSFAQISRFLSDLECLPQIVWIDGIKIESFAQEGQNVKCELNVLVFADNLDNSDQANLAG